MAKRTLRLTSFIVLSLLVLFMNCKHRATAPEIPEELQAENSISVSCSPNTGGPGTEVSFLININKSGKGIKSFGLEMTFDSAVFQYVAAKKGILTGSWVSVDGNVAEPGNLIAGGYVGSGDAIPIGSSGSLIQVNLKIIYAGNDNSFTTQITIHNYKDDISGMTPPSASTTFTFKKQN